MDGEHNRGLRLTAKEIAAAFQDSDWAAKFPPVLSTEQAAQLLQVPRDTVYIWHQSGRLSECCRKVGKHLRFFRDRLIAAAFNGEV